MNGANSREEWYAEKKQTMMQKWEDAAFNTRFSEIEYRLKMQSKRLQLTDAAGHDSARHHRLNQDLRIAPQLARFHPPQSPLNKEGCRRQGGKYEQISDNRVSPKM
jgi:hypothetical protein